MSDALLRYYDASYPPSVLDGGGGGGGGELADDFDRADSTPPGLGPEWYDPTPAYYISGGTARKVAGDHWAVYDHDLGSPDHYVEADITVGGSSNFVVLHARTSHGTGGASGYLGFMVPTDDRAEIGKLVAGTYTGLVGPSIGHNGTGKLRLEVEGDQIRLYRNGTLVVSATDGDITAGGYVGLNCTDTAGGTASYDNFRAGLL